jgi:hypothetical protein
MESIRYHVEDNHGWTQINTDRKEGMGEVDPLFLR